MNKLYENPAFSVSEWRHQELRKTDGVALPWDKKKKYVCSRELWDRVKWYKVVHWDDGKGSWREALKTGRAGGGRWACQVKYKWSSGRYSRLFLCLSVGPSVNLPLLSQEISGSRFYLQMVRGAECHLMVGVMKSPVEATGHLTYIYVIHNT